MIGTFPVRNESKNMTKTKNQKNRKRESIFGNFNFFLNLFVLEKIHRRKIELINKTTRLKFRSHI